MRLQMQFVLLLNISLLCNSVQSCPNLNEQQTIERAKETEARTRATIAAKKADADTIFIGRLTQLQRGEESARDRNGASRTLMTARFDLIDSIKGQYLSAQPLEYWVDNGIVISCSRNDDVGFYPSDRNFRYLVYAKNGEILRAKQVRDWHDDFDGAQEAGILRDQRSVK